MALIHATDMVDGLEATTIPDCFCCPGLLDGQRRATTKERVLSGNDEVAGAIFVPEGFVGFLL